MISQRPVSAIKKLSPEDLRGFVDDGDLVQRIISLLYTDLSFSDIFIHEDSPMMIKRPLGLFAVSDHPVLDDEIHELFNKLEPNWKETIKARAFDRSINLDKARIRANCFHFNNRSRKGVIIRRFPTVPLPLANLGLSIHAESFAQLDRGLVLVIGDTGQGKSTTLASLLDKINMDRSGHILTIEDPIETEIPVRGCLITQREVGVNGDCASFYVGAMDALREKADVVMIGEIRDEDTAREAVALAESGPLVFASLHAKSPEQGLAKMVRLLGGSTPQAEALSQALKGVVYQALLPSTSGLAYRLAAETITMNPTFARAIANQEFGKIRGLIESSPGCNTMNSILHRLIAEGEIHQKDAAVASTDREKFNLEIRGRS